ncbi:hypothetical protein NW762_011920 [Fusarium torreyae]|uniref:DUF7580 domain-containing protein n=1 Tax=Fusarium torreyae TaxID=1237075 RepID=A0A9W8RNX2_9HYPO|nr:hypothetical protein NW762_011920 [Fusarium torreyae]
MSGLEIAGLVLGAFPVAVEALKLCGQGLKAFRRGRKYGNELAILISRFENERVRLQDVCEKLLIDLVPHSRIDRLIENPLRLFRDEPELEAKLRNRLWKGYEAFEMNLNDIRAAMDEATERINVQIQDKSDIRRVLRHSFLNDLLSRINERISAIEQLTQRNIELEPARKCRFQGPFLTIVRAMADELFRGVRAGFDCLCEHHACLQLERRTCDILLIGRENNLTVKNIDFHLALSYQDVKIDPGASSTRKREWSEILVQATPPTRPRDTTPPINQSEPSRKQHLQRIRSASRSLFRTTSSSAQVSKVEPLQPSLELELEEVPKQSIPSAMTLDLCTRIREPTPLTEEFCYGQIIDSSAPPTNIYAVYPTLPSKYREQCDRTIISLSEVLGQNHRCMVLSEQDRLNLAVTISSSLLQLHGSAWMPEVFRSRDVYLVQSADDPICDRFFVLRTLPHDDTSMEDSYTALDSTRNKTLFYLGVLLIELALGRPLEQLRSDRDRSGIGSQFFTDYRTTKRLVDQVNSRIGPNYGSAISRCIDGEFHGRKVGLEDEDLSHDVYAGVVALLEKDVQNAMI